MNYILKYKFYGKEKGIILVATYYALFNNQYRVYFII